MSVKKFHVVVFEEEQATAIIPDLWLRGNNSVVWPPYKTSLRQNSAVQNEEVPRESWAVHPIRLLYSGKYHASCKKGGITRRVYKCARGSTSLENFHLHMTRFIPGLEIKVKYKCK